MSAPGVEGSVESNEEQVDYWNRVAGPKWVALGSAMDTRMVRIQELLLGAVRILPGAWVLDVGCGTGTTTLECAKRVGPAGHVIGVDISEPMLSVARERIAERGVSNVSFLRADAATHRFGPPRFDLIVSRFGVMFFGDPVAAFRNLYSALDPGASIAFVCWAALADNPHWRIPLEIASRILGEPESYPSNRPGPLAFSDAVRLQEILHASGFHGVRIATERVALVGTTPEEEASFAFRMGPVARLIDERVPPVTLRDRIFREISEAFLPYATGDTTLLPACVHLVTADRTR